MVRGVRGQRPRLRLPGGDEGGGREPLLEARRARVAPSGPPAAGLLVLELGDLLLDPVELLVGEVLERDELRARRVDAADPLVELELDRARVAVLAVLEQEH